MKKLRTLSLATLSVLGFVLLSSCGGDDDMNPDMPMPTGQSKTYALAAVANPSISGSVAFIENDDNSTTVTISLNNTPAGGQHPAHIHMNTAAEGGDIAITLGTVDGGTGESTVTFSTFDDGTPVTYDDLMTYDGYINVHLSATELGTIVAQGDIGQNELTGMSKTYDLGSVAVADISGTATFSERVNGEALAVLALENTPAGGSHPAHIHMNTAAEGGGISFTFNPVNGDTGMSKTNVAMLNDGTAFTYEDVLDFDGYINVHVSAEDLGTLVAQGDIGQNELTGESKVYTLNSVAVPGINGTATFSERANGEALAVLMLVNTPAGGMHPAHIHNNSAAVGGGIAFTFNTVNGDTGMSKTNVTMLDNDTAFGYADVLTFDGYINVHLSATQLGTIVGQGNIGSNSTE
ncbi:hypothetical protein RT717_05480 [Imperialibacter roseus]|uniref:CHRD domain-containing protein n=1 Tax=Imperialibacter roseus TaxID=1324217 RepID=A0ABZ0ISR3_9BACT|nr:hypothetical protein [Imperialibacter roseus]WOK08083.1 hypothetical protein RT717_05480 [Imperialibacter roseus]